jgi:hypothetical protein
LWVQAVKVRLAEVNGLQEEHQDSLPHINSHNRPTMAAILQFLV